MTESEQLVSYRQSGEIRLLGKLYQPYMELVYSLSYKYLRDEEASKDAVMQIFEKLISDLLTFEVDNFKSWLHRVTVNHCLMQIRAKKAFVGTEEIMESEIYSEMIDESVAIRLDRELSGLDRCLGTLRDEQRNSINLFFKEEKCYKEISDETGYPLHKIKSYIQNGKRNLKICMDNYGDK